jgi:hypothetical protein
MSIELSRPEERTVCTEGSGCATVVNERNRKQAMVLQYLWLKSSEQLEDKLARKAAVDYQLLRAAHAVKIYAIKYGSKLIQKRLPEGVKSIGRWWGASRSVMNERLLVYLGNKNMYALLMGFCSQFGFPKQGSVVTECKPAEDAWELFLDILRPHNSLMSGLPG